MAQFDTRADREFAYGVYRRYVKGLAEEGYLTTDQGLDGLRSYLEGYVWNVLREKEGYDLILVDEFHLFNDTERYVMHLLTRDAELSPRLILALDPRQSAFALLTGVEDGGLSRGAAGRLGGVQKSEMFDLNVAYRFSPPIHEFVCLIHESFPNLLDLGEDWVFDYAHAVSAAIGGQLPRMVMVESAIECARRALELAVELAKGTADDQRVAVVATGLDELHVLRSALAERECGGAEARQFMLLESRDDIERLNYSKRAVIVGAADYCAGLQFGHVVVMAFSGAALKTEGASARRVELSRLYLAVTRAELTLTLVTSGAEGAVFDVMQKAEQRGVALRAT